MPLIKSSSEKAFKANVAAERHAGKPIKQALAIAYSTQRNAKAKHMAKGGKLPEPLMKPNAPMPGGSVQVHDHGLIHGPGTGRSDSILMHVPRGGYMVPADIVSGIGHGNSLAGANALDHSFPKDIASPEGRAHVRGFAPLMKHPFGSAFGQKKMADGGDTDYTKIMSSAGEYFIHPSAIIKKYGSLKNGHKVLDHWVQLTRKDNIRKQQKIKPPRGAKKI